MTTTRLDAEPDLLDEARRNDACQRLCTWLADGGDRRGDGLWMEEFSCADAPAAQAFADRLKGQLGGCYLAKWVGVRVHPPSACVCVWIIAQCQGRHPDAIEPDWPDPPGSIAGALPWFDTPA